MKEQIFANIHNNNNTEFHIKMLYLLNFYKAF